MSVYLYGIRNHGGLLKIGRTGNIKRRFYELQCSSPSDLRIEFVYEIMGDASEIEKDVHVILAPSRMAREWFDVDLNSARRAINGSALVNATTIYDVSSEFRCIDSGQPRVRPDLRPILAAIEGRYDAMIMREMRKAKTLIWKHGRYRAARLAGLAKDALRHWDQPDWNPKLSTLDKVLSINQNGKAA